MLSQLRAMTSDLASWYPGAAANRTLRPRIPRRPPPPPPDRSSKYLPHFTFRVAPPGTGLAPPAHGFPRSSRAGASTPPLEGRRRFLGTARMFVALLLVT